MLDKDELYLSEKQHAITAQLGLAALSIGRLRDFQKVILDKLINNLETDAAIIGRIDDSGQAMQLFSVRSHLLENKWQSLTEAHLEMGPEAIAIATDQPLLIEDFDKQDEFSKPSYFTKEMQRLVSSGVIVPLKGYKEMLGTISVYAEKPGKFDSSDVHFLQSVASIFSLAIERRRSEQQLQQSKEKLNIILHTITDGIFAQDKNGNILYANQAALTASGYSFPENMQDNLSEADQVSLLTEALAQIEFRNEQGEILNMDELPGSRALKTKKTQIETIQFTGPNHRRNHWALFKASPVIDDSSNVEYVVNVLTDITDLKRTEKQLERYKERFELAQRSGSVGVFEWDILNDSMWWSTGEEVLFKIPQNSFDDDFKDRKTLMFWQDRVHPMDRNQIREKLSETVKQRKSEYENEFRIVYPDGEVRWLKSNARIYYSSKGIPLRMVGVNFDITDRIRKEQRKDEFISMASHELKTPLTSIKAFNQMMLKKIKKGDISADKFTEYLHRMEGQVGKLTKLVSDLLDVTKIQQGKLQLDAEPSSLNNLLHDIVLTFRQTYDTHAIELIMEEELMVTMDAPRFEQVINNLLTNAVKYSTDGSTVIVTLRQEDGNAVVSVKDAGIGIPEEHKQHITKRFYRVEKGDETKYPGLGIGLYIARQIIEQHHGQLWFESKKNRGSTFYISIPLSTGVKTDE